MELFFRLSWFEDFGPSTDESIEKPFEECVDSQHEDEDFEDSDDWLTNISCETCKVDEEMAGQSSCQIAHNDIENENIAIVVVLQRKNILKCIVVSLFFTHYNNI